jgi:hypothetical protein
MIILVTLSLKKIEKILDVKLFKVNHLNAKLNLL